MINIIIIENQYTQYLSIREYLENKHNPENIFPKENNFHEFITHIKRWINSKYYSTDATTISTDYLIQKIKEISPSIIVADISLSSTTGSKDGVDFVQFIREDIVQNKIPVVYYSKKASFTFSKIRRPIEKDASIFIEKSTVGGELRFDDDKLLDAIHSFDLASVSDFNPEALIAALNYISTGSSKQDYSNFAFLSNGNQAEITAWNAYEKLVELILEKIIPNEIENVETQEKISGGTGRVDAFITPLESSNFKSYLSSINCILQKLPVEMKNYTKDVHNNEIDQLIARLSKYGAANTVKIGLLFLRKVENKERYYNMVKGIIKEKKYIVYIDDIRIKNIILGEQSLRDILFEEIAELDRRAT